MRLAKDMMDHYLNCTMSCYWHGLSQGTRDLCEEVAPQDRPSHTHTTFILLCLPVGAMKAKVFENRGFSWKAKMQVYNAMVVPMMTYGCESWVLREKEKSRLQATEMSILRKVTGVTRMDHIKNEDIRHRLQQRSIVDM